MTTVESMTWRAEHPNDTGVVKVVRRTTVVADDLRQLVGVLDDVTAPDDAAVIIRRGLGGQELIVEWFEEDYDPPGFAADADLAAELAADARADALADRNAE
jgi:hypothetical protein